MALVTDTTTIISIDELPDGVELGSSDLIMLQRADNSYKLSRSGIKVNDYNVISTQFSILSSATLSANMEDIDTYLASLNSRVGTVEGAYLDKNQNLADIPDPATARSNLGIDTVNSVINKIYPVGAIYITTTNNTPQVILGVGTWQRYGEGRMMVGYSTSDATFGTVKGTGGSKTVSVTGWGSQQSGGTLPEPSTSGKLVTGSGKSEVSEDLESLGHATTGASNLPPYIVTYMWIRIS